MRKNSYLGKYNPSKVALLGYWRAYSNRCGITLIWDTIYLIQLHGNFISTVHETIAETWLKTLNSNWRKTSLRPAAKFIVLLLLFSLFLYDFYYLFLNFIWIYLSLYDYTSFQFQPCIQNISFFCSDHCTKWEELWWCCCFIRPI